MYATLHDPDLVAIGGLGAALATVILAIFAGLQMKAARDQIKTMKTSAEDQIAALRDTTDKELALVQQQIGAAMDQNEALRDSSRAQLQPIVFAHGLGDSVTDPMNPAMRNLPPGRIRVTYHLRNEGVGPALDVEHGISVGGVESTPEDAGARFRTLAAGEEAPPMRPNLQYAPLYVDVLNAEPDLVYWTRFSNVFNDRFEVLNYPDGSRPAVFRMISRAQPAE